MKNFIGIMSVVIVGLGIFLAIAAPESVPPADRMAPGDLWIKTALESVMEKEARLGPGRVEVSSLNGTVELDGTVLTDDEKGRAELLATQIPGVQAVENDIRVLPAVDPNSELEKEAQTALIENPLLHIDELRVHARNGVVTLEGIVQRAREKHLAQRLVAFLPEAHRIVNKIEILHRA